MQQNVGLSANVPKMRKLAVSILAFAIYAFASTNASAAKDFEVLVRYLVPVSISQFFFDICYANDSTFLSDQIGGAAAFDTFARQFRREIVEGLTATEQQMILVTAAENALQFVRGETFKLTPNYPQMPAEPLAKWCREHAKPFLNHVMQKDIADHEAFLKIISQAKR